MLCCQPMSPSPMPGAPSPLLPLHGMDFFLFPHCWCDEQQLQYHRALSEAKGRKKRSQTPPCLLLELSRLFSRGCVNPRTMKGNSYVNQTSAPCSPPSPHQLPYMKWLFSSCRNDKWLVAFCLDFSVFFLLQPWILGLRLVSFCSCIWLLTKKKKIYLFLKKSMC